MTVGWFYGLKLLITGNVEKKDIALGTHFEKYIFTPCEYLMQLGN